MNGMCNKLVEALLQSGEKAGGDRKNGILAVGEHSEQLDASLPGGFKSKLFDVSQTIESTTIRNGRRVATAENFRANGKVKFVHQPRAEQGVIQFAATFAEQPVHPPFLSQPLERGAEIDFFATADFHDVGQCAQLLEPARVSAARGQDDNGRKTVLEHSRSWIN